MAVANLLLYETGFTGTAFTVVHNLDRLNLDYRIVCSGSSRPDLIDKINFTTGNERNSFSVTLTSSNVGIIQLLDYNKYALNLPSPERINIGSQMGFVSGTTLNGTTLELGRTGGLPPFSTNLSSIDKDRYVTGATLNSTTLELERNGGLPAVTVDLANIDTDKFVSGGTFNTGTSSIDFIGNSSDTTFSVGMGIIQHDRQSVSATMAGVTQTSYTAIPTLDLTTGNLGGTGDYIMTFNCYFETSKKEREVSFIMSGNSFGQLSNSERVQRISKDEDKDPYTLATSAYVENLSSGNVITVAFKNSGNGTITISNSTLTIDGIRTTNNIS